MIQVGSLLLEADHEVADWVRARIPNRSVQERGFGQCRAVGVVRRGQFVGGIVFHGYEGHIVQMSGAFDDPTWCLPGTLRGLFDIPFNQYGVAVMWTMTARKNKAARKVDEGVGFKLTGVIPKGWDGKDDACIYHMTREDCRWLRRKNG